MTIGGSNESSSDIGGREPRPYAKRNYAAACVPCRERKIKCSGTSKTPCDQCEQYNTICEVPEPARYLKRSKRGSDAETISVSSGGIHPEVEQRLRRIEQQLHLAPLPLPTDNINNAVTSSTSDLEGPRYALGSAAQPVYHGETSMHDHPDLTPAASPRLTDFIDDGTWSEERIAETARMRHKYAPAEDGEAYLAAYFSWASPVYNVVYRPLFIRHMATNGPYFSHFLLVAIYITGIRFMLGMDPEERRAKGERYLSIAMSMMTEEVNKPSSMPTIQALLALAGRQSAVGNSSQAWLYTGMAIRMIQDMGIHLPSNEHSGLKFSEEEREMRVRLYWSAYCWDKTISMTLGREPALLCRPGLRPEQMRAEEDDSLPWQPFFPPGVISPTAAHYPSHTYHTTFALRHFCHLNIILESILTNMYSPERPNARSLSFVRTATGKLEEWRQNQPRNLKLEGPLMPSLCPPTHFVVQNLLYHIMRILLYRPLLTSSQQNPSIASGALDSCRSAAMGIHSCLSLWGRSFGNINYVYLQMYCCFVAAGVDVILLRVGSSFIRDEALQRVHLSIDILEQASNQGPGIRKGIGIIKSQLARATRGDFRTPPNAVGAPELRSGVALGAGHTSKGMAMPIAFTAPKDIDASLAMLSESIGETSNTTALPVNAEASIDPNAIFSAQQLFELLGQNDINSSDPFAFMTETSWGDWTNG